VFKSFQRHKLRYLVIGGVASVIYGVPRATFDLDILIDTAPKNAQKLIEALLDAGFGTASMTNAEEILSHEITIFKDRVRIDVQTLTPGLNFKTAWKRRKVMTYQGQKFYIVSLEDLVASKIAAGRNIDLEDVRLLKLSDEKQNKGQHG
jgi:predicted nucleotidyltransferase